MPAGWSFIAYARGNRPEGKPDVGRSLVRTGDSTGRHDAWFYPANSNPVRDQGTGNRSGSRQTAACFRATQGLSLWRKERWRGLPWPRSTLCAAEHDRMSSANALDDRPRQSDLVELRNEARENPDRFDAERRLSRRAVEPLCRLFDQGDHVRRSH